MIFLLVFGQVLGIVAADRFGLERESAAALALASLLLGPLVMRRRMGRALLAGAVGWACGAYGMSAILAEAGIDATHGIRDAIIDARVCGLERGRSRTTWILCDVVEAEPAVGTRLPSRLLLDVEALPGDSQSAGVLSTGGRFRLGVRVRPIAGFRNPGRASSQQRWRRKGIGARARLRDPNQIVAYGAGKSGNGSIERWRGRVAARVRNGVPGSAGPLMTALSVGDRSHLDEGLKRALARLGLAHLLAVSGLHLSFAAGAIFLGISLGLRGCIGFWAGRDLRSVRGLWVIGLTGLYAYGVGFGPPVVRAWVLVSAWAIVPLLGFRVSPARALALAGSGILLATPWALYEAGAQLSFAATAAIVGSQSRAVKHPRKSGGEPRMAASIRISAVAMAATGPILASHGLPLGTPGLLINLLAVPWTGFVLLPAAVFSACLAALDLDPTGWAWGLPQAVGHLSVIAPVWLADHLPSVAGSGGAGLCAISLATGLALVASRASSWRPAVGLVLLSVFVLSVGPRAMASLASPPRIVMFDVGLGDAILVQGRSASILVDGGRALEGRFDLGESVVLPALSHLGIHELDVLVASHADLDHQGGLKAILQTLPVGEVWLPWGAGADPAFHGLIEAASARSVEWREMGRGRDPLTVGDLEVEFLWPPQHERMGSDNEESLVLRVSIEGQRLLLTGDIGAVSERRLLASEVDVSAEILKIAHHGSGGSSTLDFLITSDPSVVLLSAPCRSRSPLPHPEVMRRVRSQSLELGWTGRDGAVVVPLRDLREGDTRGALTGWGMPRSCWPRD